jgi:hypothetical protein
MGGTFRQVLAHAQGRRPSFVYLKHAKRTTGSLLYTNCSSMFIAVYCLNLMPFCLYFHCECLPFSTAAEVGTVTGFIMTR